MNGNEFHSMNSCWILTLWVSQQQNILKTNKFLRKWPLRTIFVEFWDVFWMISGRNSWKSQVFDRFFEQFWEILGRFRENMMISWTFHKFWTHFVVVNIQHQFRFIWNTLLTFHLNFFLKTKSCWRSLSSTQRSPSLSSSTNQV